MGMWGELRGGSMQQWQYMSVRPKKNKKKPTETLEEMML